MEMEGIGNSGYYPNSTSPILYVFTVEYKSDVPRRSRIFAVHGPKAKEESSD
jgi:hypothetical protein